MHDYSQIRTMIDIHLLRKQRGIELKELRCESGLNHSQLSALSGISRTTISKIENAKIGWSVNVEIIFVETIKTYNLSKLIKNDL